MLVPEAFAADVVILVATELTISLKTLLDQFVSDYLIQVGTWSEQALRALPGFDVEPTYVGNLLSISRFRQIGDVFLLSCHL